MTTAVAVTENKPRKIHVPEFDSDVYVLPQSLTRIRVCAHSSILIDNLLYSIDAQMGQHRDGGPWYFITAKVLVPTLAPKKTANVIEAVTRAVNRFMEANPDYLDVIRIIAWEAERAAILSHTQSLRASIAHYQERMKAYQTDIDRYEKLIAENEQKLAAHDAERPDGHAKPEAQKAGVATDGAIEGVVVSATNGTGQHWSNDPGHRGRES